MRTHAIHWHRNKIHGRVSERNRESALARPLRLLLTLSAVTIPAAAVIVLVTWASGTAAQSLVSASLWASGFIFLALSVDSGERRAMPLAVSGLVLMILAWLSQHVTPEFGVLAGFMVAGWAGFSAWSLLFSRAADESKLYANES